MFHQTHLNTNMKKILLAFATSALAMSYSFAQVLNPSFENWGADTSYLDLTSLGGPKDTAIFQDPNGWTSVNAVIGGKAFGVKQFVTPTTQANLGANAVRCVTDTVTVPVLLSQLTLPGFVISGDFKISLTSFVGNNFSPTNIPGAGIALTPPRRIGKLEGYYQYAPVAGKVGQDSCAAIAVLKKGNLVVAQANFFAVNAQSTYAKFSADFVYSSCLIPDSAVIILSSSNPYSLESLLGGGTATLPIGGAALFDDIALVDTTGTFSIPPIANVDTSSTMKNTPKNISVLTNDESCYGGTLSAALIGTSSPHGTLSIAGGVVTYTPTTNYVGGDTFYYTLSSTGTAQTAKGMVTVTVKNNVGINAVDAIQANVYPNPVQTRLTIEADAKLVAKAVVTDVVGKVVAVETISSDKTVINTTEFQNGLYVVSLVDATGRTRFMSKIAVEK